ncbi:hypothetical protein [Desulfovibrio subterraneus]|uniref:Uncharacterized protein n=1 Tax=Desulfovibrio subterraneus TaxID=2718620 RepID=A0A7J0BMN4_9BACT|nr:hypothetical protein [Desulfovibrio subterraneus]GFM34858.1 hypothetical protein DSM101010T_32230 [Desulfovibrio subterraneus]
MSKETTMTLWGSGVSFGEGHGRIHEQLGTERKRDTSVRGACKRCRNSCRTFWCLCAKLVGSVNASIALIYDSAVRPEMHCEGYVFPQASWKIFGDERKEFLAELRERFPKARGVWRAELGRSRTLHMHIALNLPKGKEAVFEEFARATWGKITGCYGKRIYKMKRYSHSRALSYLYSQGKVKFNYPLHAAPERNSRHTWGAFNGPLVYEPIKLFLPARVSREVRIMLKNNYKNEAAGRSLRDSERKHLRALTENGGVRHGLQKDDLKLINRVLEKHGLDPVKLKKKRYR